ncbi:flagellar basal body rod protein FlgB [Lysinibacillus sp. BF-4]|uniref:Flagellar basal body rod protein FlgB n=1 Tax=Metalysinibacillus saudimassiliensis TaxID=1461583 RepID=A0A078MAJ2_9BACL|nr:flagellar basal body rod protein FlgB [Lysinibacillus sp. BF-4]KFL44330.1 flagellar basal body rod protein FlgB [Lysinibacillus sp. BF-4]CEA04443.1 Flagellar basal body rod protein FlgB [Metalysinibacillus saudimassiliensis]
MNLFGGTIRSLESGLTYASTKQKVIAQNIANVDTPNYKAKDVSFKRMLAQQQQAVMHANRTDARHFDFTFNKSTPGVYSYTNLRYRANGNGVDMDKQQAELAENVIYNNALIERLNGKFRTLNTVIKGGK